MSGRPPSPPGSATPPASPPDDFARWAVDWQRAGVGAGPAPEAAQAIATARRGLVIGRLIEGAVAAFAILVTAVALRHAGNPFEAALGLVVGVGVAGLWIQRMRLRAREHAGVAAASPAHLATLASVRRQEVRLGEFIWIVIVLELVFLTPWWVIGTRVHHRSLTDLRSWVFVWGPLVVMGALAAWARRLRAHARGELQVIESLREQYRDPARGEGAGATEGRSDG